jgi:cell division septal protein FtsQ
MTARNKHVTTVSDLAARHTRARCGLPKTAPRTKPANRKRTRGGRQSQAGPNPFGKLLRTVGAVVALMVVIGSAAIFLRPLLSARFFTIKQVELEGAKRTRREDLLSLIEDQTSGDLWQVDLEKIRELLKRNAWVRDVEVTRQLPDKLHVQILEREPFALVRHDDNSVVWIDRDGTVLGDQAKFNPATIPPIISGLAEGTSEKVMETNRRHLTLYQELLNELDGAEPLLSPQVDEVIFDGVDGLKLRVQGGKVEVLVGTKEFRKRTHNALRILQAVERRDISALQLLKISDAERLFSGKPIIYINATVPARAIVGLAE